MTKHFDSFRSSDSCMHVGCREDTAAEVELGSSLRATIPAKTFLCGLDCSHDLFLTGLSCRHKYSNNFARLPSCVLDLSHVMFFYPMFRPLEQERKKRGRPGRPTQTLAVSWLARYACMIVLTAATLLFQLRRGPFDCFSVELRFGCTSWPSIIRWTAIRTQNITKMFERTVYNWSSCSISARRQDKCRSSLTALSRYCPSEVTCFRAAFRQMKRQLLSR